VARKTFHQELFQMLTYRSSIVLCALWILIFIVISPIAIPAQTFTEVIQFGKSAANPYFVTPIQGRDGRIYVTTTDAFDTSGAGTVFVYDVNTGSRSIFYSFDTPTGANPVGGLTLGTDGNFYGTAQVGGTAGDGVLYRLSPEGDYTVLHNFTGGTDGIYPAGPPVEAANGNFYGVTGLITAEGDGPSTAYEYAPSTGAYTSFGYIPETIAPLIQGTDGNLYGTSNGGCGSIFEMSTSGAMLSNYDLCGVGGEYPIGPIMQASNGNFYGVTQDGGNSNYGMIYELDANNNVSLLYDMTQDSTTPDSGLIQANDGNLYASTWYGTLFEITTGGDFTLLYYGPGGAIGAALLQHTNGQFYGTAYVGGSAGKGAYGYMFSLNTGLAPFVAFVKAQGRIGSTVQILGQGFTGSTAVTFNGVAATSFDVVSNTYMTAVVPSGATNGPVIVTTPTGTLTSNRKFRVMP
jgi:uncharacterized repeat protein (TIGR03803 family)